MNEEFFETDDPATRSDLQRIDRLVCSDAFLKGLGEHANDLPPPEGFPLVRDIAKADELLRPSELFELPEPWPYHEFYGGIEEESGRIQFRQGMTQEQSFRLSGKMNKNSDPFHEAFLGKIYKIFERENVVSYFLSAGNAAAMEESHFMGFTERHLPNNIHAHVYYIIKAVYFGGLDNSPLFKRMFEAFQTGGFPCGWLGPYSEGNYDPVKSVALLHLGRHDRD